MVLLHLFRRCLRVPHVVRSGPIRNLPKGRLFFQSDRVLAVTDVREPYTCTVDSYGKFFIFLEYTQPHLELCRKQWYKGG